MTTLKNPYLSSNSQNLLLRRNFNAIKSPSKQPLYPGYDSSAEKFSSINYAQRNKNQQSTISTTGWSSFQKLRNPFSAKTLDDRKQSLQYNPSRLPSYYTQPYLTLKQKEQLPFSSKKQPLFPSYKLPQQNRILSVSSYKISNFLSPNHNNLPASNVKNIESLSLERKITDPYKTSYTFTQKNNDWNTQKWKKQLQRQERNKLQKYGSEALRYNGKIPENLNNQYYSTSKTNNTNFKVNTGIPYQTLKEHQLSRQKNIFSNQIQEKSLYSNRYNPINTYPLSSPKDPETYLSKHRDPYKMSSFIQEQGQIKYFQRKIQYFNQDNGHFLKQSKHYLRENQSLVFEDFKSNGGEDSNFFSRYQGKEERRKGGPLDLDVFDSIKQKDEDTPDENDNNDRRSQISRVGNATFGHQRKVRFSRQQPTIINNESMQQSISPFGLSRYQGSSLVRRDLQNITKQDYPQKIQFRKKIYYRIKLG